MSQLDQYSLALSIIVTLSSAMHSTLYQYANLSMISTLGFVCISIQLPTRSYIYTGCSQWHPDHYNSTPEHKILPS